MSITDELRDCIRTANRSYEDARNPYNDREILHIPEEELLAIADSIDEQHRKALEKVSAMVDEHDAGWSGCRFCKAHKREGVVECQAYANMLRCDRLEKRVSIIERKLNHKGGAE